MVLVYRENAGFDANRFAAGCLTKGRSYREQHLGTIRDITLEGFPASGQCLSLICNGASDAIIRI